MVNQQTLKGHWDEIQGKLRDRWGQLTNDELDQFEGDAQQLVGMIERKTGESREQIENYLEEITSDSGSALHNAAENVRHYAETAAENVGEMTAQASTAIRERAKSVADTARTGYENTERLVRDKPAASLAVCFGVGMITGVIVGLAMRK